MHTYKSIYVSSSIQQTAPQRFHSWYCTIPSYKNVDSWLKCCIFSRLACSLSLSLSFLICPLECFMFIAIFLSLPKCGMRDWKEKKLLEHKPNTLRRWNAPNVLKKLMLIACDGYESMQPRVSGKARGLWISSVKWEVRIKCRHHETINRGTGDEIETTL